MEQNKKGFTTFSLIVMIILGLVTLIIMGIMVLGFDLVSDSLNSINLTVGNTTFNETYQDTLGQGIDAMRITVPRIISLGVLFGMILIMFLIGYYLVNIDPLWMILDFIVIIVAELLAFQVSTSFQSFINSSPEFLGVYSGTLNEAATFILRLPTIIPVVGVLIMFATYLFNKRRNEKGDIVSF